jgi:hypothetical protein
VSLLDLPPTPATADPLILPGLLAGLGITPSRVPRWASDPNFIASIEAGHIDIDDEYMGEGR